MTINLPVPVLEIFHIYDIPERFFNERCNAIYFDKLCERLVDLDHIDPSEAFALPHLHDRYHMMLNYFVKGIMFEPTKFIGLEGQKAALRGIFAILYTYWDYKFEDISVGIDSGITQLKKYQDRSIELPNEEKYVCDWITSNIDVDKVVWMLEMLKLPYNDNFGSASELDINVVKLLRDTMSYGALYCVSYYPKELQEIQNYSLIMTLLTYYGVTTMDKVHKCFNTYFRSPLRHEPYTNFTKKMIEIYNANRSDESNILNNDSIKSISRYLELHGSSSELDLIKTKEPLPINDSMNIY